MSVRLSTEQAWAVLAEAHTGVITTLRADGAPVSLPTWYVVLDRTIGMVATSTARRIGRIRRDPRAAFLVESGERWAELQAVHLNGTVEVVEDEPTLARINQGLADKYEAYRTATAAMSRATREHYASRTHLLFRPDDRILSWDNRLLRLEGQGQGQAT